MIRAVLDTNVLVSGFVRRHPEAPSVQLVDAWRAGTFQLVVCEEILDEVAHTLNKPYFKARLTEAQIERTLFLLRRHAFLTRLTEKVEGIATHPEDDRILDAAVSGGADTLVTGDGDLVALGAFRGVAIRSPRNFLEILREATS